MKRPWITALNVLLGAAALALLGFTVRQRAVGLLTEIEVGGPAPAPVAAPRAKTFSDVSPFIGRNLFNADTLSPAAVSTAESLEATRLPLRLLATLSAGDQSWAAVEDSGSHQHLVARVNEPLCNADPYRPCQYGNVILQRVERCRIVLENQNRHEELRLDGMGACAEGGLLAGAPRSARADCRTSGQRPCEKAREKGRSQACGRQEGKNHRRRCNQETRGQEGGHQKGALQIHAREKSGGQKTRRMSSPPGLLMVNAFIGTAGYKKLYQELGFSVVTEWSERKAISLVRKSPPAVIVATSTTSPTSAIGCPTSNPCWPQHRARSAPASWFSTNRPIRRHWTKSASDCASTSHCPCPSTKRFYGPP